MLVTIKKAEKVKAPKIDPLTFISRREDDSIVVTFPAVGMGDPRSFVMDEEGTPRTVEDARAIAQLIINRRSTLDAKGLKKLAVHWAKSTRFTFSVVIPVGNDVGVKTVTTLPGIILRVTAKSFVTAD